MRASPTAAAYRPDMWPETGLNAPGSAVQRGRSVPWVFRKAEGRTCWQWTERL